MQIRHPSNSTRTTIARLSAESIARLDEKLGQSAFRRGTSAFRLGLIQQGISDHLPFSASIDGPNKTRVKLTSWNLLADAHLYNNFLNVSGIEQLSQALKQAHIKGNIYFNEQENRLFYFFAELAQHLYRNQLLGKVVITQELLQRFISIKEQSSQLARAREPQAAKDKETQVEAGRAEIIAILIKELNLDSCEQKTNSSADRHEFKLAINHSLELLHHIENVEGALRWENRFKLLKKNRALVKELVDSDFLCLQECSKPDDIHELYRNEKKQHSIISYKIGNTDDYCVLTYDKEKYTLVGEPIKFALEGKKPCIFAKFSDHAGTIIIVASIHHPGGKKDFTNELLNQVALLKSETDDETPYYLLGDYNHTKDFFFPSTHHFIYPDQATMAGSDYGNVNKSIDAVISNQSQESINVKRLANLLFSTPATALPIVTEFRLKETNITEGFFGRKVAPASLRPKEITNCPRRPIV